MLTGNEKCGFWVKWTFQHTWAIPVSYVASLIIILIFSALFGTSMNEYGTKAEQMFMQIAGSVVLGLGVGLLQRSMLRHISNIRGFWLWSVIAGFVVAEIIAAIVCWRLDLDRMQLRFIELNALPESAIFALAGLIIGIIQWFRLKKQFTGSLFWILASAIGWAICIIVMEYPQLFDSINKSSFSILADILVFAFGSTLYGAVTGAVLMWVMHRRVVKE